MLTNKEIQDLTKDEGTTTTDCVIQEVSIDSVRGCILTIHITFIQGTTLRSAYTVLGNYIEGLERRADTNGHTYALLEDFLNTLEVTSTADLKNYTARFMFDKRGTVVAIGHPDKEQWYYPEHIVRTNKLPPSEKIITYNVFKSDKSLDLSFEAQQAVWRKW